MRFHAPPCTLHVSLPSHALPASCLEPDVIARPRVKSPLPLSTIGGWAYVRPPCSSMHDFAIGHEQPSLPH